MLITGAHIHIRPGETVRSELQVAGSRIAANDIRQDGARRIGAQGASVVPLFVDTVFHNPDPPAPGAFDLTPGNPATFAVVKGRVSASRITRMLVVNPCDLVAVVVDGEIVALNGEPERPAGSDGLTEYDPRLGPWTGTGRDMTQYLTRGGRYSETRNGRRNAYTGRFWLNGDRITYLDATGFWAFGQYHNGILHHAGYVLYQGSSTRAQAE